MGSRAGDEGVQLSVEDVVASVTRPVQELRGFERITLPPRGAKRVTFPLGAGHLGFYDRSMRFVVEPGLFRVRVSTSSEGGLLGTFEVQP